MEISQTYLYRFHLMNHEIGDEMYFLKYFFLSTLKVPFVSPLEGLITRIESKGLILREKIW